ncbi:trm4b [Symbiodinium sp. CCMP2592]|nr:trm4b [Symbiodinium sp. CCMP2592]
MTRARHERHRRDKEAQKRWLSEKRRGVQEDAQQGTAAEDFRSYYNAQFCHDHVLATEQAEFWSSMESALPVTVRVSSSPASSHTEARLASFGWHRRVEFDRTGLSVWEISSEMYSQDRRLRAWTERENRLGSLCFQELVSLIPPILLDPQPKEVCLDLCAAPGNKSLQLLESLASKADVEGAVLSADNDPQRCCLTLHRVLGKAASPASCAALANAAHFPVLLDQMDTELVDSGFGRLDYDRILADVPCSGDGTARKNTQVFRGWSRREALELSSLQRRILLRGLYLLPPQGTLVYSTCSLNPLENEAVVLSCLRRWNANLHSQGNAKMPVSLLDAQVMVERKCGLRASTGMTNWVVPAPQRGGPWFTSWEEVPEELRNAERFALRSDMFPAPGQPGEEELSKCARFYPHHSNTGGFFVAVFRKAAAPSDVVQGPRAPPASQCEGRGGHPLLSATFHRVSESDREWQELREFYGVDAAWSQDKLKRGLLLWQTMKGKTQPERITLVSEAVARLFNAVPGDGRRVAWARMGVFLFEHLPKGLLAGGVAPCRWRPHAEAANILAPILHRRRVYLKPDLLRQVLCSEHRQSTLTEGTPLACAVAAGAPSATHHHVCGGLLLHLQGSMRCWAAGVATPKQHLC